MSDPAAKLGLMEAPARWSSVVVDVDAGRVTAEGVDGRWSGPCGVHLPRGEVVRALWTPASAELVLTTRRGTEFGFDLPGGRGVDGRPVVYLDQNVWSALARVTHRPERLPRAVLDAARRLTRLAADRVVVLPMSSSHMLETTRWSDDADRVALAETMLRLSRGWCVRHPLRVRALEMRLLLGLDVPAGQVLGPGVWPLDEDGRDAVDGPAAVAAAVVLAETLLDPDPVPRPVDLPWAEARQAFAATLPAKSRLHVRDDLVAGHVWQDLFPDLAEAALLGGMSVWDAAEWVAGSDGFARLPATGLFAGMMAERLVNVGIGSVNGPYGFMPLPVNGCRHSRPVAWFGSVSRAAVTESGLALPERVVLAVAALDLRPRSEALLKSADWSQPHRPCARRKTSPVPPSVPSEKAASPGLHGEDLLATVRRRGPHPPWAPVLPGSTVACPKPVDPCDAHSWHRYWLDVPFAETSTGPNLLVLGANPSCPDNADSDTVREIATRHRHRRILLRDGERVHATQRGCPGPAPRPRPGPHRALAAPDSGQRTGAGRPACARTRRAPERAQRHERPAADDRGRGRAWPCRGDRRRRHLAPGRLAAQSLRRRP